MFSRSALLRTRAVVGVFLLGGTIALCSACGTSARATQVSADSGHTCAVVSGGKVDCWGWVGGRKSRSVPVRVSGIKNATQVNAGDTNNCALLSNHEIKCWGSNFDGQLGNGMKKGGTTPVRVSGIKNATQVSAGDEHTCALLSNHRVDCWGDDRYGKLGDGVKHHGFKNTYGFDISPTPVQVSGITNATAISAGGEHTCALLSGGTLRCWGSNVYGELGNGGKTGRGEGSSTPVPAGGITNAVQVSAGGGYTCAVLSNHKVKCWGATPTARSATEKNSSTPVPVSGITNATAISAGADHTCALLSGGTLKCWGYITADQPDVGYVTTVPVGGVTLNSSTPVPVSGITNATAISAGVDHTCALLSGGTLKCWGDNTFGELGNGGKTGFGAESPAPVTVVGLG